MLGGQIFEAYINTDFQIYSRDSSIYHILVLRDHLAFKSILEIQEDELDYYLEEPPFQIYSRDSRIHRL